MKRFFNYALVILLLICALGFQSKAQVKVSAALEKPAMLIGEQTKLHLSIRFPAKDTVGFPQLADSLVGKVQILSISKLDTTFDKNDLNTEIIHRSYTITSFDTGQYVIPQYAFRTKAGVFKTEEQVLTIKSVAVDTTKGIYDIKQPLQVKYAFMDWLRDNWKLVALGAAFLAAIIGLIIYLLKRPVKQAFIPEVKKVILPPHIEALEKLNALREEKLWQHDQVKEYHSQLTDVIREYLEKSYGIKALEQTSDEIFTSLKYMDIPDESRVKLRQVLILADLAKFAKQKPLPAENEQSIENAIAFVMGTKKEIKLKDQSGEGGSNELV
jgi:hypothetical protein